VLARLFDALDKDDNDGITTAPTVDEICISSGGNHPRLVHRCSNLASCDSHTCHGTVDDIPPGVAISFGG